MGLLLDWESSMKQLIKNLGYQTIYQMLAVCLPLITTPYISRVLGAESLGIYSYTYSIVNYFTIFAMMGILNYGSRSIAIVKKDKQLRSKKFWEIYSLQLVSSLMAILGYCVVIFISSDNKEIVIAQAIWVVACIFDISWFFFGIESFKVTVIRNTVIKLLTVIAIFLFVRTAEDLWKYVVIMSMGTLLSQLALWPFLRREIIYCKPSIQGILSHLKPNFLLFIPLIATSVYHIMDKTMLGIFSTYEQSGFYYNADKVINIPLSLITAMGTVMLPRMSFLVAEGRKDEEGRLFNQTLDLFMFLTYAMSFGIVAVAQEFIPVFFGNGYEVCIQLIYVFAIVMIIKSLSSIIRNQYLIPNNEEKVYTCSVIAGAILNFICNYVFLVPLKLGAMGATLGTLIAEFATCLFYVIFIQRRINILKPIIGSLIYVIPGLVMIFAVQLCALLDISIFVRLVFEIAVGAGIYLLFCIPILKKKMRTMSNAG